MSYYNISCICMVDELEGYRCDGMDNGPSKLTIAEGLTSIGSVRVITSLEERVWNNLSCCPSTLDIQH